MRVSVLPTALGAVGLMTIALMWPGGPASAQTSESLAGQYRPEAMEQALATRERYQHYGIHFDTDQAGIQAASEPLLDDIATALRNFPDWQLRIAGHTDSTGDPAHNRDLSLARANAVRAALEARGVAPARLATAGFGADRPVAENDTAEGRALNRRVELVRITDSAEARALLKAMSDYLGAQERLAFEFDATLEVVTLGGQRLGLANSGTVTLERPDHIRASRTGGFLDVEIVFDGTTLTLLGKGANLYTQVEEPGSVERLIDRLRDHYGRPLPAADLLFPNPYDALIEEVYDAKDLGSGVIGGTECDWLAFRTDEVDWQIWIAQGERPYPCRYVITTKGVDHEPQYSVEIRNWRTGAEVPPDSFAFANATGAQKIEPAELRATIADLPGHFQKEDAE